MNGYQRTAAEVSEPSYPELCGIAGCSSKTAINIQRNGMSIVTRCAAHYLDEVANAGKSADGNPIQAMLQAESNELREVGLTTYRKEARQRQRSLIDKMQKPEMKPKEDKIPDQEYFCDQRGIEDLMQISAKRGGR